MWVRPRLPSIWQDTGDLPRICGRPHGCGHMSGLLAQSVSPLALMKSDNQESHQGCELHAHATDWAAPGLRWRPLSFITSLLRLPNFNQLNLHSNIAMRNSSSRFGEHLGTEAFPVFHHRPDNPSEFVGQCDGHKPCRLLRQQSDDPVAQAALPLAYNI